MEQKQSESKFDVNSVLASAKVWSWQHDEEFERQTIEGLHRIGQTLLPYATVIGGAYVVLDYLSAPANALAPMLLLRALLVGYLVFCCVYLYLTEPGRWTTLVCASAPLVSSFLVILMTLLWDPGANLYGSGIVVPMTSYVILTRKPIHTLLGVLFICLAYPLINIAYQTIPSEAVIPFVSHILIVSGTCLLVVLIAVKLHQLRWQAYSQQKLLEAERDKIADMAAGLELRVLDRTKQLKKSNEIFSRFVPAEFLRALGRDDVSQVKLGDARKADMTVVYADLENFALMSEVLGSQQTMDLLNRILSRLGPCVRNHGGFVDKFIGDSIMALFPGAPEQALLAAQDMCHALFEAEFAGEIKGRIVLGIGVHSGSVMMGTLGEAERFEATAIGDTVNVSSRVNALTHILGAQVLLTGIVFDGLSASEKENCRWLGLVTLKGRSQAVDVYECFATESLDKIPALRENRVVFETALRDYFEGNVAAAHAVLEAIAEDCPWDKPLQFWLKRCTSDLQLGHVPGGSLKHVG